MREQKAAQAEKNEEGAENASIHADEDATQAVSETRTPGGKRRVVPLAVVGPTLPFDYLGRSVTTVCSDLLTGWFVVPEVAAVIGLKNPTVAIKSLDDDEKGIATIQTAAGPRSVNVISESGLYTLISRSSKPEAKAFRRWVMGEVLPTLRRTGRYEMPGAGQALPQTKDDLAEFSEVGVAYHVQVLPGGRREVRELDSYTYIHGWAATEGLLLAQSIQMIQTCWNIMKEYHRLLAPGTASYQAQKLDETIATGACLATHYINNFARQAAAQRGEDIRSTVNGTADVQRPV